MQLALNVLHLERLDLVFIDSFHKRLRLKTQYFIENSLTVQRSSVNSVDAGSLGGLFDPGIWAGRREKVHQMGCLWGVCPI
jgi:hypothetical protein